jgi:hypothetical protein
LGKDLLPYVSFIYPLAPYVIPRYNFAAKYPRPIQAGRPNTVLRNDEDIEAASVFAKKVKKKQSKFSSKNEKKNEIVPFLIYIYISEASEKKLH